jgi:hypothetical protein
LAASIQENSFIYAGSSKTSKTIIVMTVRSLDFLDLPLLPRYRREVLPLDSARILTRGNPLGAAALLSYLNPRRNIYTGVSSENGTSLMGQIILGEGETSARLTFLAPSENIDQLAPSLLDHLVGEAGEWGAFHLLAEVNEDSPVFRTLRRSGFAMYAWQRAWKLPVLEPDGNQGGWRPADELDWPSIQSLYGQIVPALLQPVESLPKQVSGLVCRPEGNLQAYIAVNSGPAGVWVQPLIPPDSNCVSEQLTGLAAGTIGWRPRDVYVCVRSYQAWLESVLEDLGAQAGPRQAVMVRRLAKTIKDLQPVSAMEKALVKAKPAAPISQMDNGK